MEKYGRVLVIIFFLVLINLGLSIYTLSKLDKPVSVTPVPTQTSTNRTSPQPVPTTPATIQSDLNLIKAEIRALRDALDVTGLILETPAP